jgi:hypothetical protein
MSPRRRHLLTLTGVALSVLGLAGCVTGERPTLEETASAASVGDAPVDAVISRLETTGGAAFTATYELTNNYGPVTRTATVSQLPDGRRSVTIGDVRFLFGGASNATCQLGTGVEQCRDGVEDAAVSDLQVTHQFYDRSAVDRLRTDAGRDVGFTEGYATEIAGQPATCVSVPVNGGAKVWCALDSGPLASYQGPDVTITMTSYSPVGDETLFARQ